MLVHESPQKLLCKKPAPAHSMNSSFGISMPGMMTTMEQKYPAVGLYLRDKHPEIAGWSVRKQKVCGRGNVFRQDPVPIA
jgi:hypothetical protein